MSMKILVTGACGYKGSVLVPKLLAAGHAVTALDTMWFGNFLAPHPQLEILRQDVRDADLLLVNYCKSSIGTAMETFYASYHLGKFVIAFSPLSFADASPWMVRFCTKILPDLEAALTYIEQHFT